MRTPHIPRHSTRRAAEPAKRRVKRWLLRRAKESSYILESASEHYVKVLPRSRWDQIVLFMFTCCLFIFLHALGGLGFVEDTPRPRNHTLVHPSTSASFSPTSQRGIDTTSIKDRVVGAKGVTRVVVGWHGEYELIPSAASNAPAPSIPQDAFPDPTPVLYRVDHEPAMDIPLSMTSGINPGMDFSAALRGIPYDPFRLDFEGEPHGLYPVAEPPSTARANVRRRRFGRCVSGEDCI